MKTCSSCKIEKPLSEYYIVKGKPAFYCKSCRKEKDLRNYHQNGYGEKLRQRRKQRLDFYRARDRQYTKDNPASAKGKLLKKYWAHLTKSEALLEYKRLLESQGGVCAICSKPETCTYKNNPNKIRDLCVDHCHVTGKVRGLLCDNCNVLLGRAKDDAKVCELAAVYLRKAA